MEKKRITVSQEIRSACPEFVGGALYATFVNTAHDDRLWKQIESMEAIVRATYSPDMIKLISGVSATREAYRACGKDPSRYRPSNEQLLRRVVQGKQLYAVNTAVDIGNLASMACGYSIGCFDYDKIQGSAVTLGIGREGEPYEGIGRGTLNITGMPVYRDESGGIGTPTSDNERTKMSISTCRMLALVNGYDGDKRRVEECVGMLAAAFEQYLGAECEKDMF